MKARINGIQNHVVIDLNNQMLRCEHCGVEVPNPTKERINMNYAIACMESFAKLHKECKPSEENDHE